MPVLNRTIYSLWLIYLRKLSAYLLDKFINAPKLAILIIFSMANKKSMVKTIADNIIGGLFCSLERLFSSNKRININSKNIRNILVFSTQGVGNNLLFTPTLRNIRNNFPDAKISYLASKWGYEMMKNDKNIDKLIYYDIEAPLIKKIMFFLKLRKNNYDIGYLAYPSNNLITSLIAFIIGPKIRVSHKYKIGNCSQCGLFNSISLVSDKRKHDVTRNLEFLRNFGLKVSEDEKIRYYLNKKDSQYSKSFLKSKGINKRNLIVGMHIGSASNNTIKRWSFDNFIKVIDYLLSKKSATILLFAGEDELSYTKKVFSVVSKNKERIILVNQDLRKVAALISNCNFFISNDSGLMHLAVALDIPTIAIFGPSEVYRAHPIGNKHITLTKNLRCSPCYRENFHECPLGTHECLVGIKTQDVIKAIEKIIKKNKIKSKK